MSPGISLWAAIAICFVLLFIILAINNPRRAGVIALFVGYLIGEATRGIAFMIGAALVVYFLLKVL